MLAATPVLLAVVYGLIMYRFSVWRTQSTLKAQSRDLTEPDLIDAMAPLARALDLERIRVRVYEIDPINGLATPDGKIYITRGFIERFRAGDITAPELMSVIAHELGHVALGHSRRRMIDFSGQNALRTALALVMGRFLPGIGPLVANAIASLLAASLSRRDEFEADAYATALMIKAGYGAAPQKSLFHKLDHLSGKRAAGPAWLMSHPKTHERIKAIETNENQWLG
ncbi:MAG: M48 family metallopeptidase [Pseudomonadota bacterium]